ncbi:hypothetical protein DM01DRAFT_1335822 [Hesseltinella vesiculosa]|uniref:Uncharacterized protein n=1 Tax=Hesseltinella vesiculosa TaxID=101127 RepID=A0A1X2GHF1_9FUNG|nr:hypothetical protein DM01DRAFT_1335822 [Hesseltinella vesiculosa]
MKFLAATLALAATPVFAMDLINCSIGKHIWGQYPSYKCGVEMGWDSGYVGSGVPLIGGVWARKPISQSELNDFAACCAAGGKPAHYALDQSDWGWDLLHAALEIQGKIGSKRELDTLQAILTSWASKK